MRVLVTGATGEIGLQTAKLSPDGAFPCSSMGAIEEGGGGGQGGSLDSVAGRCMSDFYRRTSPRSQVRALAEQVVQSAPRLDVLINNAGCGNFSRTVTADGYETTFAVNHLAPFLLTNLLLGKLAESCGADCQRGFPRSPRQGDRFRRSDERAGL